MPVSPNHPVFSGMPVPHAIPFAASLQKPPSPQIFPGVDTYFGKAEQKDDVPKKKLTKLPITLTKEKEFSHRFQAQVKDVVAKVFKQLPGLETELAEAGVTIRLDRNPAKGRFNEWVNRNLVKAANLSKKQQILLIEDTFVTADNHLSPQKIQESVERQLTTLLDRYYGKQSSTMEKLKRAILPVALLGIGTLTFPFGLPLMGIGGLMLYLQAKNRNAVTVISKDRAFAKAVNQDIKALLKQHDLSSSRRNELKAMKKSKELAFQTLFLNYEKELLKAPPEFPRTLTYLKENVMARIPQKKSGK